VLVGPDPHPNGVRQRFELARAVPKGVCVRVSSPRRWAVLTLRRHLKPGVGHIEQIEIDLRPRCDDGTLSDQSPLVSWYKYLSEATTTADRPIAYRDDTKALLQRAGFIDIREQTIRAPINPWSTDPHQREIGKWYNLGLSLGLEALSLAAFTRVNSWNPTRDIAPFLADVKTEMCKKGVHAYNNMWVTTSGLGSQANDG
jgi:hypothetical protein